MTSHPPSAHPNGPTRASRAGSGVSGKRGLRPVALAAIVTLALGGASMARAVPVPELDAHADLEFSLDGADWGPAPDEVLGSWGCAVPGVPVLPDPTGALGGTSSVDPCSMAPGESITRTYHVRNASEEARTGRFSTGVGEYVVSEAAEFDVRSTITAAAASDSQTVPLYGPGTPGAGVPTVPGSTVATLDLAPGQAARVVDMVEVPTDSGNSSQRQSVSPMMWVSFTDIGMIDTDGDGLPDDVEDEVGLDPNDPLNVLPWGIVGVPYWPRPILPTTPDGARLDVDASTLPPGLRLEDGELRGVPTKAGTYDVGFTVTLADGSSYTSIRRVVIYPVWIAGVVGSLVLVGAIVIILGDALGSSGSGGSAGSGGSSGSGGSTGSSGSGGSAADGSNGLAPGSGSDTDSGPGSGSGANGTTAAPRSPDEGKSGTVTGTIDPGVLTPRTGAPPADWIRANSQVRGSLAETGTDVSQLLLWALTAAGVGVTLLLLATRRRGEGEQPGDD